MPASLVVNIYYKLERLVQASSTGAVSGEQVKQTLAFAEQFVAAFKQNPDLFVAQPLLYKSKQSFESNLAFNYCVYTCLLCNQNNINLTCTIQMICSVISLCAEQEGAIARYYQDPTLGTAIKPNTRLVQILSKSYQQVWLRGYEVLRFIPKDSTHLQHNWPMKLSRVQRLIYLAFYIAVHVTHNRRIRVKPFANVLKALVQCMPSAWLDDIQPLLHYPSLISPGTLLKVNGKSLIALSVGKDKVLACGLTQNEQNKLLYSRVFIKNIEKIGAPQKINGFSQINQWWNDAWLKELPNEPIINPIAITYKLDQPPAILLEVQEHLNSHDIDIDKLALMISAEPAFAEYVKTTATFSNRHKLPVQQVKHGLMMHGYERTNHMLIQQALLLRLNQNYFPLQQEFIQFTRLRAQIAEHLAEYAPLVGSEQASTLACFASSGLFTQSTLKGRRHWQPKPSNQQDIQSLFLFSSAANLHQHAMTLAQAWQQPIADIMGLQYHNLMPETMTTKPLSKQLAVIMGLSLIKARQCYFNEAVLCEDTRTYIQQALAYLQLPAEQFEASGPLAMSQNHSYCALS